MHFAVSAHPGIDASLNLTQLRWLDGAVMGEIEAQALRGNERTSLGGVFTHDLAQRPVQQVCRRVVALNVASPHCVNRRLHGLADLDSAARHRAVVDDQTRGGALRIGHLHRPSGMAERAGVADLPATFGVKRCAVKHDLHRRAHMCKGDLIAVRNQRKDRRSVGQFVIAGKKRQRQASVGPDFDLAATSKLRRRPRAFALLGHRLVVARFIHAQTLLSGDLLGEIEREAEGVL